MTGEKPSAFDTVAARARQGMAEMTQALALEVGGERTDITGPDAASAIATGALCQAVELFFGMTIAAGMPMLAGRAEIDQQVDTYWKQAVVRHLTMQARAAAKTGKGK